MPIFARAKLVIHDDCLAPPGNPVISLNYKGPNPQNLYKKIKELIFTIWKADAADLQEREFVWDRSAAEEKFSVRFDMVKDLDRFTFVQILITLSGNARHSRQFGREGEATIKIEGRIRTEYPQDTLWQRSLIYEMFRVFYHKVIYEESRKKYKNQCRQDIFRLQEEIKSFLNLLPKGI